MRFTIEFEKNTKTFIVTTKGAMTIKGEGDMIMQLISHPLWHAKHNLVVDHRQTDTAILSDGDITTLSVLIEMFAQHLGDIKTAIIMSNLADLKRVKEWQQQISNIVTAIPYICQDMQSAMAWLANSEQAEPVD